MAEDYIRLVDTLLHSPDITVNELRNSLVKEDNKQEHETFGMLVRGEIDEEF
jgi:hypothetical protein